MTNYLERKQILSLRYFGLRKTRFTENSSRCVNKKIKYNISYKLYTARAALNLSKAFHSISHTIMCVAYAERARNPRYRSNGGATVCVRDS